MIYILFHVGTEQIRPPWPFLGFWRGLGLWPQFFYLNQQIYVVTTYFEKKNCHSSPHMLKITKPNYLQISLHHPVVPFSKEFLLYIVIWNLWSMLNHSAKVPSIGIDFLDSYSANCVAYRPLCQQYSRVSNKRSACVRGEARGVMAPLEFPGTCFFT